MAVLSPSRPTAPPSSNGSPEPVRQALLRRRRFKDNLAGYAFLAPQLIGLLVFMIGPLIFAVVLSLSRWDGFGDLNFVGLSNFGEIFSDPQLMRSVVNTVWFTVLQVPGLMLSALCVAVMLQRSGKLKSFYRVFYFAPVVTSTVAVAAIWLWLFNPDISPINGFLAELGLPAPDWLQDSRFVIAAFAIVGIWQGLGYQVVIFMAGLENIPKTLLEAAEIDGASEWQKLWKITLPLLSPTILFLSITSVIGSFQVFDYIYVFMDTAAPAAARTVVYEIVRLAFSEFKFGLASAVASCLFMALLCLTGLQLAAQKRWVHYTE
ncbi:sugar ABC transporter permease [Streptomyces sioyaensis]|uniref:carbohydrate ABC transporter permease n=1 Tax=Streptomyces sioyaensis TaxID=67364 RepID=UPI003404DC39